MRTKVENIFVARPKKRCHQRKLELATKKFLENFVKNLPVLKFAVDSEN